MFKAGIQWLMTEKAFISNRLIHAEVEFRMAKTPRQALTAAIEWLDVESRFNEINNLINKMYENAQ